MDKLTANKAISAIMKENGFTQARMATCINKKKASDVSARLASSNMTVNNVIEMLSVMGYELVIQKKTPGSRAKDQIVIEREDN